MTDARSFGYVGARDGGQDLKDNFKMDWEFQSATNGNIALTAEINLPADSTLTFTLFWKRDPDGKEATGG